MLDTAPRIGGIVTDASDAFAPPRRGSTSAGGSTLGSVPPTPKHSTRPSAATLPPAPSTSSLTDGAAVPEVSSGRPPGGGSTPAATVADFMSSSNRPSNRSTPGSQALAPPSSSSAQPVSSSQVPTALSTSEQQQHPAGVPPLTGLQYPSGARRTSGSGGVAGGAGGAAPPTMATPPRGGEAAFGGGVGASSARSGSASTALSSHPAGGGAGGSATSLEARLRERELADQHGKNYDPQARRGSGKKTFQDFAAEQAGDILFQELKEYIRSLPFPQIPQYKHCAEPRSHMIDVGSPAGISEASRSAKHRYCLYRLAQWFNSGNEISRKHLDYSTFVEVLEAPHAPHLERLDPQVSENVPARMRALPQERNFGFGFGADAGGASPSQPSSPTAGFGRSQSTFRNPSMMAAVEQSKRAAMANPATSFYGSLPTSEQQNAPLSSSMRSQARGGRMSSSGLGGPTGGGSFNNGGLGSSRRGGSFGGDPTRAGSISAEAGNAQGRRRPSPIQLDDPLSRSTGPNGDARNRDGTISRSYGSGAVPITPTHTAGDRGETDGLPQPAPRAAVMRRADYLQQTKQHHLASVSTEDFNAL